jgi:hypothetical protein
MKSFFKQSVFIVGLIVGLSSTTLQAMMTPEAQQPLLMRCADTAGFPGEPRKLLELVTAILRLPGGILEDKLRNDDSLKATIAKMAINATRLINDLCSVSHSTKTRSRPMLFGAAFDITQIARLLKKAIAEKQNTASTNITINDHGKKNVRRYVLPFIESLCAVMRCYELRGSPIRQLSRSGVTLAQLGELYLSAAENSTERKVIGGLLAACVVEYLYTASNT